MNILEFITKLFGNKAQKDMREIQPYVDQVKAVYPEIDALSNDDLRARSQALMDKIAASVAPKKQKIAELRASMAPSLFAPLFDGDFWIHWLGPSILAIISWLILACLMFMRQVMMNAIIKKMVSTP